MLTNGSRAPAWLNIGKERRIHPLVYNLSPRWSRGIFSDIITRVICCNITSKHEGARLSSMRIGITWFPGRSSSSFSSVTRVLYVTLPSLWVIKRICINTVYFNLEMRSAFAGIFWWPSIPQVIRLRLFVYKERKIDTVECAAETTRVLLFDRWLTFPRAPLEKLEIKLCGSRRLIASLAQTDMAVKCRLIMFQTIGTEQSC